MTEALIDTRVLGKGVTYFYGKDADFGDWEHGLMAYFGALDPDIPERLEECAKMNHDVDMAMLQPYRQKESKQIYYVLSMLCKKKALKILRKVKRTQNGYEGWRRLWLRYRPESGGRELVLHESVLYPNFPTDTEEFEDALMEWENDIDEYEDASGEEISDKTRISIISRNAPEPLRGHLRLNTGTYKTYEEVKTAILKFLVNSNSCVT